MSFNGYHSGSVAGVSGEVADNYQNCKIVLLKLQNYILKLRYFIEKLVNNQLLVSALEVEVTKIII